MKFWDSELGIWSLISSKWLMVSGTTPRNAGFWNLDIWFKGAKWLAMDFSSQGVRYLEIDIWRSGDNGSHKTFFYKEWGYHRDQCRTCREWRGIACPCRLNLNRGANA